MASMSLLQIAWLIAVRRLIATWRLELVLFLGILLAVALMSGGVAFSDLLAEAALRRALTNATPEEANFAVRVFNDLGDPDFVSRSTSTYWTGVDFVAQRVGGRFRPYLKDQSHLLETSTLFFKGHPHLELANEVRPRGKIQYMSGLEEKGRTVLVRGRWPGRPAPGSPPEVALDTLGADLLRLSVGDELEVFPAAGPSALPSMKTKIVGVFRRVNPGDEFWYGASRAFSFKNDQWTIVPLFTTQETILEQVARVYPGLYTDVTWFFYLDRDGIRARDVDVIQDAIRSMEYDVRANLPRSSWALDLDRVLERYQEQLLLARIPLFLMVFLVAGILVYYLSLVAGLLVRSRSAEISMLKSRGATTFQVGLLALVEGLLLAVPAVILGPLLALGLAGALGRFFFGEAGGGVPLPLALSSQAFLLGVGGSLLAVAVITIATLMAARHGIVQFHQIGARPPRSPFIQRYYLDLLLLALIGLLWWQLQTRGSFLVRSLETRELAIDFSLLLGPVLGLLALGLLVLRLFPVAVALLARVAEPIGPVWLVQGLRHVARDPILPGSLVLLLMLATALGVLGSAFSATLERGQRDRAWYAAGADLRLQHLGDRTPTPLLGLAELAGRVRSVERAAEVQRASGSLLTSGFSTTGVAVLAVDQEHFAQVAWYRPDFAGGKSLESLTRGLAPFPSSGGTGAALGWHGKDGIPLSAEAAALAVWVHPGRPDPRLSLQAGLQDSRGYYFDACLGEMDFRGWRRLEVQLTGQPRACGRAPERSPAPALMPPFILLSLEVVTQFSHTEPGILFLDRVVAVTPKGEEVLDDFQTLDGWQVVEDYTRPGLYALDLSESVARSDAGRAAAFSWAPGGIGVRGIRAGGPERPIPAVVSSSLLQAAEVRPGDTLTVSFSTFALPVQVTAVAEYFPTLDPEKEPFVVVDLKTFNHYANRHSLRPVGGSNELWLGLADDAPAPAAVAEALEGRGIGVRETHLASQMVSQRVEQPLVSAGWRGLLVLVFLTLVLANASGVMLFSYVDTRERQTEFALLRTLGSSPGQLNGVAWFNLFLVVACGIGLGTWAGFQLGNALLPLLGVAEEGVPATPPLVLQTNWVVLLASYLLLGAVTVGTVVWLAWLTAKLDVQRVLRVGEA
jgi:ABC-type lipoprotein release transport system permease subunit